MTKQTHLTTDPWLDWIGELVFIRTVTVYHVGRLVAASQYVLVLEDAAWVADTGRFSKALTSGTVTEAEPFPDGRVLVSKGAVVDACLWTGDPIRAPK